METLLTFLAVLCGTFLGFSLAMRKGVAQKFDEAIRAGKEASERIFRKPAVYVEEMTDKQAEEEFRDDAEDWRGFKAGIAPGAKAEEKGEEG